MLKINWKYLILLGIIAGVLYFTVSIFTLGTVEAIEGNFAGYLLLFISWIVIIVIARIFQDRLRIKELIRFLMFGMIMHIYFCLFYFLSQIDNILALITLPLLFIPLYALYNKEGFLNLFGIFRYYMPFGTPGHPFAYDKEYKAYIFKNFNSYEVLKYLEIRAGKDPVELLTIFYKANVELSIEIHHFNKQIRYFCGILTKSKCHVKALEDAKRKFYELFKYLRYFGYDPVEVWDDFTLEKILEGPYLSWDPIEYSQIKNNHSQDNEQIVVQTGMKRKKISLFQLVSNNSLQKNQPKTRISIRRGKERQTKTEIIETNMGESGLNTFIERVKQNNFEYEDFIFILRLHPFDYSELNKEKKRIRSDLLRVMNKFKMEFATNEANYRMLQFNNVLDSNLSKSRNTQILNLLYPDEAQELEKNWDRLENHQLGEEMGYWQISTYFVGRKFLANILATDCKSTLHPLHIVNFQHIIRRRLYGKLENSNSKEVINFLPFSPVSMEINDDTFGENRR